MATMQRNPRDILLDTDAEYQRLFEQHEKYDLELQRILKEPYLSSEDGAPVAKEHGVEMRAIDHEMGADAVEVAERIARHPARGAVRELCERDADPQPIGGVAACRVGKDEVRLSLRGDGAKETDGPGRGIGQLPRRDRSKHVRPAIEVVDAAQLHLRRRCGHVGVRGQREGQSESGGEGNRPASPSTCAHRISR